MGRSRAGSAPLDFVRRLLGFHEANFGHIRPVGPLVVAAHPLMELLANTTASAMMGRRARVMGRMTTASAKKK